MKAWLPQVVQGGGGGGGAGGDAEGSAWCRDAVWNGFSAALLALHYRWMDPAKDNELLSPMDLWISIYNTNNTDYYWAQNNQLSDAYTGKLG